VRSEECLEKALVEWAALYRRKMKDNEIAVWKRIFSATDPRILALALEEVTTKAERMPSPGHLSKAIAIVRDNHPELIPKTGLYYVLGRDSKGVACVYWSDEGLVPAYRAQECPEGRNYLAKLKEFFKSKDLKPPNFGAHDRRKEMALPFAIVEPAKVTEEAKA
jgi:hypothetical protein